LGLVFVMTFYLRQPNSVDEPLAGRSYWHRGRAAPDDQSISLLFWLAVFVLGWAALILVNWGVSAVFAKNNAEKPLLGTVILPKLNISQGEKKANAFFPSQTLSSALDPLKERNGTEVPPVVEQLHKTEGEHPAFSTPEPELLLTTLPRLDALPAGLVETCDVPVVYLKPCTLQREDSPMIRTWKTLTLYSLLSAATVMYVPQPAVLAQEGHGKGASSEELNKLTKSIKELSDRIKALEDKKGDIVSYDAIKKEIEAGFKDLRKDIKDDIKDVSKNVDTLSKNVDTLHKNVNDLRGELYKLQLQVGKHESKIDYLAKEIDELHRRKVGEGPLTAPAVDKLGLDEIRRDLNSIKDTIAKMAKTTVSSSAYPNGTTTTTAVARVKLTNLLANDVGFTINNVNYRVPGGFYKEVEVPVGLLRYDIFTDRWGYLDRQVTSLSNGEILNLTAYNPR
jgi:outer membrane murein-binding lipoprotein Lpp